MPVRVSVEFVAPVTYVHTGCLPFRAVCKSVWSERVQVIEPQVPPPLSFVHSVSKSLLLLFTNFCHVVPPRGTPTPLLHCGHVNTCFSYGVRSENLSVLPSSHLSHFSPSLGLGILLITFFIISFSSGTSGFIISFSSFFVGASQFLPSLPFSGIGICGNIFSITLSTILLFISSSFFFTSLTNSLSSSISISSSMLKVVVIMLSFLVNKILS